MAFEKEILPTITGRGAISISLYSPDKNNPEDLPSDELTVQLKLSNGEVLERKFSLLERLRDDTEGKGHLQALIALRDYILARVDTELIGL